MHKLSRPILRVDDQGQIALMRHPLIDAGKGSQRAEHQCRGEERTGVVARPYRKPHARDHPEARRRRETCDGQSLLHDRASPQKTDAAHDLRCKPCRVCVRPPLHILVKSLRKHHDQAGTKTYQHIRAKARRFSAGLSLVPDDTPQNA